MTDEKKKDGDRKKVVGRRGKEKKEVVPDFDATSIFYHFFF